MIALKAMGCDIVQGYYFSRPVPPEEFAHFVEEKGQHEKERHTTESALSSPPGNSQSPSLEEYANRLSFTNISSALSCGFETLFYVDTSNGYYMEFSTSNRQEELQSERGGEDFFGDIQRRVVHAVHPDDRNKVAAAVDKNKLIALLNTERICALTYRLMRKGQPVYCRFQAVKAKGGDDHHVVIGINSVDEQTRQAIRNESARTKNILFYGITQAVSNNFETIYYVDTETELYTVFSTDRAKGKLEMKSGGIRFFEECRCLLLNDIYDGDRTKISASLRKNTLLNALSRDSVFQLDFRLMFDDQPVYHRMKAFYAQAGDDHHILLGISNIDAQMTQEEKFADVPHGHITYSRIAQALSQDYFTVYYVNTVTDRFIEYKTLGPDHQLALERTGEAFFEDCKRTIPELVLPEDRDRAMAAFEKQTLLQEVADGKTFTISYRLLVDGSPIYANLKALRLVGDASHIIIAVSDIDAQMRRKMEFEAAKEQSVTYARIAQALAADYFSIYYVDVKTDRFIEYFTHETRRELSIKERGENFFHTSRKDILRVIHPEDQEKVTEAISKEKMLRELDKNGTFTLNYRMILDDTPTYVSMKATRMEDGDGHHIVIGVNHIDAQMRWQEEFERVQAETLTYARLAQALSRDYYCIYLVNEKTNEFFEYHSHRDYQGLQLEQSGTDFFETSRRNTLSLVYPDDMEKALSAWDRDRLLPELADGRIFSTTYRLMMDGVPVYINLKASRLTDGNDNSHIVIGISNVDAQIRREQELGAIRDMANRDALTGVKSKHAFVEMENSINDSIAQGDVQPFSVVVCDVNDLKTVNDTLGHKAGDRHIQAASRVICTIFKHSPIYRVGGDEFVVILTGSDYEKRSDLMRELMERNLEHIRDGKVTIASGLADYLPGQDSLMSAVFERADSEMYAHKATHKDGTGTNQT